MIHIPVITPIMPYYLIHKFEGDSARIAIIVMSAIMVIGLAVFLGWTLSKVMRSKGFVNHPALNMILAGVVGLGLFIRYGLSVMLLQGLFLFFALLYASMSDLTSHTVDDSVWLIVFALALCSIPTVGLSSMTIGALFVFIPQMALALIPPHKTLGGADIKLSTALAFLLGAWRGVGAYFFGLVLAVIIMSIYNYKHKSEAKKPFALVPFLGIGAMILFFV